MHNVSALSWIGTPDISSLGPYNIWHYFYVSQNPDYPFSGYPLISTVMYAVHVSIVSPGSRFTSLKSMGEGRSEMRDFQITLPSNSVPFSAQKKLILYYTLQKNWYSIIFFLLIYEDFGLSPKIINSKLYISLNSNGNYKIEKPCPVHNIVHSMISINSILLTKERKTKQNKSKQDKTKFKKKKSNTMCTKNAEFCLFVFLCISLCFKVSCGNLAA